MSSFTDPLDVRILQREIKTRGLYKLLKEFTYEIGEEGSGVLVEVPAGFVTDLASVPWFIRWLISPGGLHAKASVIHDYLYSKGVIQTKGVTQTETPTRLRADQIMKEAMVVLKVPCIRRWMIYKAVRWFAKSAFKNT